MIGKQKFGKLSDWITTDGPIDQPKLRTVLPSLLGVTIVPCQQCCAFVFYPNQTVRLSRGPAWLRAENKREEKYSKHTTIMDGNIRRFYHHVNRLTIAIFPSVLTASSDRRQEKKSTRLGREGKGTERVTRPWPERTFGLLGSFSVLGAAWASNALATEAYTLPRVMGIDPDPG